MLLHAPLKGFNHLYYVPFTFSVYSDNRIFIFEKFRIEIFLVA